MASAVLAVPEADLSLVHLRAVAHLLGVDFAVWGGNLALFLQNKRAVFLTSTEVVFIWVPNAASLSGTSFCGAMLIANVFKIAHVRFLAILSGARPTADLPVVHFSLACVWGGVNFAILVCPVVAFNFVTLPSFSWISSLIYAV